MTRIFAFVGAAIVGAALALVTVFSVVSSQTAAPASNPAGQGVVQYGSR